MNKILILAEKKYFEEIFRGLYEPNGFQIAVFTSDDEVQIVGDDHFIVIRPSHKSAVFAEVVARAKRRHHSDIRIICASETASFRDQFNSQDIDVYFSENSTLGEIKEAVRQLMFCGRLQIPRTEAVTAPA